MVLKVLSGGIRPTRAGCMLPPPCKARTSCECASAKHMAMPAIRPIRVHKYQVPFSLDGHLRMRILHRSQEQQNAVNVPYRCTRNAATYTSGLLLTHFAHTCHDSSIQPVHEATSHAPAALIYMPPPAMQNLQCLVKRLRKATGLVCAPVWHALIKTARAIPFMTPLLKRLHFRCAVYTLPLQCRASISADCARWHGHAYTPEARGFVTAILCHQCVRPLGTRLQRRPRHLQQPHPRKVGALCACSLKHAAMSTRGQCSVHMEHCFLLR
jgi:hypothetical protein